MYLLWTAATKECDCPAPAADLRRRRPPHSARECLPTGVDSAVKHMVPNSSFLGRPYTPPRPLLRPRPSMSLPSAVAPLPQRRGNVAPEAEHRNQHRRRATDPYTSSLRDFFFRLPAFFVGLFSALKSPSPPCGARARLPARKRGPKHHPA